MARKRRSSVTTRRSGNTEIVVVEQPRAMAQAPSSRVKRRGGRKRTGAGSRSSKKNTLIGAGIGGLAYGFVEKMFPTMPTIPIIGKAGTVAVAAYFVGGNNAIINDIGIAAAAIAGYQLGKDGAISGEDY